MVPSGWNEEPECRGRATVTNMAPAAKAGMEVRRIVKAAELIHLDPIPEDRDKAFMASALVQVTLPHSNPGDDVPVWGRTNGNLSLTIKPDWVLDPNTGPTRCIGLPYGTIPRLLLFDEWNIKRKLGIGGLPQDGASRLAAGLLGELDDAPGG